VILDEDDASRRLLDARRIASHLEFPMYAVVASGGQQHKVTEGQQLTVKRLAADVGSTVELDQVLLVGGGDETHIGAPTVAGAKVTATVVSHDLGEKRDIFKYKRRQRYRRSTGFRPSETTLTITGISVG
jgi:large subunit ribosomal protein L21